VIKENAGDLLVQIKLFDTYAPEGGDKTSYAFNLVFQSQEKTLTDEEINEVMNKITQQVEFKGWKVR
jgi:phenylalanyl-tRNA synthetase beta chain